MKEQEFITSKSNIFSLYIYNILYMYIDLHLQYMYVYHVHVYGSTKRWTSDLDKTFLAVGLALFAQDVTRLCETRLLGERLRLQKGIQALQEAQRR